MIKRFAKLFFDYRSADLESMHLLEDICSKIEELEERLIDLELRVDNTTHTEYNLKSFSLGE